MAKKSASQIAAEQEYFRTNNIQVVKQPKKERDKVRIERVQEQGITYGLGTSLKSFGIYVSMGSMASLKPLKYMNDKEIVTKLIDHYQNVLDYITKPDIADIDIIYYINKTRTEDGLCLCARVLFGVDICQRWWIMQFCVGTKRYWYETPEDLNSSEEKIGSVSFRLNKLKEILNSIQEDDSTV